MEIKLMQKRYNYKSTLFWLVLAIIVLLVAWFFQGTDPSQNSRSSTGKMEVNAKVVRISDGDTFEVIFDGKKEKKRIRMLAIDAPELKMKGGAESKKSLTDLIKKCVFVQQAYEDQYKRVVGKVLCDGQDLNLEQIKNGHAWLYERHRKDAFAGDGTKYAEAQKYAKEHNLGLWKEKNPKAPWEWRKENPR